MGIVVHGIRKTAQILLKLFWVLVLFALVACGVIFLKYHRMYLNAKALAKKTVSQSTKETFDPGSATVIYDKSKKKIVKLSDGNRKFHYLSYENISNDVKNAFIAIEDRTFWKNQGYDPKGMARVIFDYVRSRGNIKHGASTITQQLVRSVFLTRDVTMNRKINEIMISKELSKKYSKKQILEFYINNACFANNIYGIEEASEQYLGKSSKNISLSQTAYLCSIPNYPEFYNPWRDPHNAIKRRNKILKDMLSCGYINKKEYKCALNEKIKIKKKKGEIKRNAIGNATQNDQSSYAISCACKWLMKRSGFRFRYHFNNKKDFMNYRKLYLRFYGNAKRELYQHSYKIYTSLDTHIQKQMQKNIDSVLSFDQEKKRDKTYALQGSVTVIDNKTGKVIALVGGRSQKNQMYGINRAFQVYRQPGSTIKPLVVYTPSLLKGFSPNSILKNISVSNAKHTKDISSMGGAGIKMSQALQKSLNGCAYWLFNNISPAYGLQFVENMEFDHIVSSDYSLSAALGGLTYGTNTLQMASAYATIENLGAFRSPTCICSVKDKLGRELYKKEKVKRIYYEKAAAQATSMMRGVLDKDWGTAHKIQWKSNRIQAAGKTGTTNKSKDGWFCGYTPYYTVSTWVGYDLPRSLSNLYGATYPAEIWKSCMDDLTNNLPAAKFNLTDALNMPDKRYESKADKKREEEQKRMEQKWMEKEEFLRKKSNSTSVQNDMERIKSFGQAILQMDSMSDLKRETAYNLARNCASEIKNVICRNALLEYAVKKKERWDLFYHSQKSTMDIENNPYLIRAKAIIQREADEMEKRWLKEVANQESKKEPTKDDSDNKSNDNSPSPGSAPSSQN